MAKNLRKIAVDELLALFIQGKTLSPFADPKLSPRDNALVSELCFGLARFYYRLDAIASTLMQKPLGPKDRDVHLLLLLGLYQLDYMRIPSHAAVFETVAACSKKWAKGLLNACLRNYERNHNEIHKQLERNQSFNYSSPAWLIKRIKKAYPEEAASLFALQQTSAPMTLRIDLAKITREQMLADLAAANIPATEHEFVASAVVLEQAIWVENIPHFKEGLCSVQDASSQLAAFILAPQSGEQVLDACAAPGGKACHLWQAAKGQIKLTAVDSQENRIRLVKENFERLAITATVLNTPAEELAKRYPVQAFDKILLDAPCSSTGVIRRHPDILLLRTPEQISELVKTQALLLNKLWPLLKVGGKFLYATCSLLPEENETQIERFLKETKDAKAISLDFSFAKKLKLGVQILGQKQMDAFYYCLLEKTA